jgi:hypothetical protein
MTAVFLRSAALTFRGKQPADSKSSRFSATEMKAEVKAIQANQPESTRIDANISLFLNSRLFVSIRGFSLFSLNRPLKNDFCSFSVIPKQAGIQAFQAVHGSPFSRG